MKKRSLVAMPALALGLIGLSACSPAGAGDVCAPAGKLSKGVEVAGAFGSLDLELTSKTPVSADAMQRSVLTAGTGEALAAGAAVQAVVSVFSGEDGERISAESARLASSTDGSGWIDKAIGCSTVGDRVATVLPAADVYGEGRVRAAGIPGLTETSSLLIVLDLQQTVPEVPGVLEESELLERAEGEAVQAPDGLPTVELAETGEPTVSIPEGVEPPTEAVAHTLIVGEGETVLTGDRVYLRSKGVIWGTGNEFESTWGGSALDFITTGMLPGLAQSIEGERVGSQLLIVVPAEDGYGSTALDQMGHAGDDVMVFVIDILGTVHPAEQ